MKWLLLASLTLFAGLAALAAALRTKPSGRAELALTTGVLWQAAIAGPIYALASFNRLTPPALGVTSCAFSALVVGATAWRGSLAKSVLTLAEAIVNLVTLPFEAIARAVRARSLVLLPLVLAAVLIVYTGIASYFTPSWRQWDSLWYHETIVGLTIQNHGFAMTHLPDDTQKANAYPRLCEMMDLWFVIFTDRRLIDVVGSLIAPGFMYAIFLIARRYTRDIVVAIGWAAVVMAMPTPYFFQITYADLESCLIVLAASYYVSRPEFRLVNAWLAALCITMAIGTKYLALPPTGIILIIAIWRLISNHRFRLRSLATLLGGGALIAGMSAGVFWRNWRYFKNPMWPDLVYDNPKWGLHFKGMEFGGNAFDLNMKVPDLLQAFVSLPYSGEAMSKYSDVFYYGVAVTLVVFPLCALALLKISWLSARHLVARIFRVERWLAPSALNAMLVALPLVVQVYLSPEVWQSRYHIANVGAAAALAAFLGGRPRWHGFGEGAVAAASVLAFVAFTWTQPRWLWLPSELASLAKIPYPEREVTPATDVSKAIDFHSGSSITRVAGLARETLKPGEIFAWDYTPFPALLWKNDFSNKVIWAEPGQGYFDRVNAMKARLALCQNGVPHCADFIAASSGPNPTWKDVGVFNVENWSHVYRRLTP